MREYKVWLETGVRDVGFDMVLRLPDNLSKKEIDQACKDSVLEELDWGWQEAKKGINE